jgi:hypothetical protein
MNHKQRSTLHALFAHPVSGNIDPQLTQSMLEALGGEMTHGGHSHVVIRLNGPTQGFHASRHALSKDEVGSRRKFLETAGIEPTRDFPLDANAV